MRNTSKSSGWGLGLGLALIAVLIVGGLGFVFYQTQLKTRDVTVTIDSKERIAEEGGGKYVVFTDEDEVYQVTDNILFGKTDSSNRYAALDEGKTYDCTAVGVRVSLLSWYQNLIDCEEVAP